MKTLKLKYSGDMCPHCANLIEEKIQELEGVSEARISVMTGVVKIKVNTEQVEKVKARSAEIVQTIEPSAILEV